MNNEYYSPHQFVISPELLELFKWLLEYEQDALKKLIDKSLRHGLHNQLYSQFGKQQCAEELQRNIIDFFVIMETILYESMHEDEGRKAVQRTLLPAIDRIDAKAYDNSTLNTTIARATVTAENHPERNPKEILCKELLRRWKPKKLSTN